MTSQLSAKCTLWVNRIIGAAVILLLFLMPRLMGLYTTVRPLDPAGTKAVLIGFYCCAPVVVYALWCIDCLLRNILLGQVFVLENVCGIRRIRWCCAGVSGICLPASFFYPPLIFLVVIMVFLTLVVSVVNNVMAAAVEIREENDLTV